MMHVCSVQNNEKVMFDDIGIITVGWAPQSEMISSSENSHVMASADGGDEVLVLEAFDRSDVVD